MSTVFATPADAHHADDLVFLDESKLDLSLADARAHGTVLTVCNVGVRPAEDLRVRLLKFKFKEDGGDREPGALLELVPPGDPSGDLPLAPAECRDFKLRAKAKVSLDADDYPGLVVATASGGVARKRITITNSEDEPAVLKAAGEAGVLEGERWGADGQWLDEVHLTGGGDVAVKAEETFESPPKDTFVGNVFKDNEVGRLYVRGPAKKSVEGVVLVPLRVEGLDEVGEYKGSVDFTGGTAKDDEFIPVTLKVTDHVLFAIAAIVLGAAIPLGLQLYLQRHRPLKGWRKRLRDFKGEYAAAQEKWQKSREPSDSSRLANAPHPLPDLRKPAETSLTKHVRNIENAIGNYKDGNLFLDKGADAYKAIDASIAAVADDINCFGNEDGLAAQLRELWTALDKLVDFLNTKFPTSRKPRFLKQVANALKVPERGAEHDGESVQPHHHLEVGEALKRAEKAKALVAFMAAWRDMAEQVGRYRFWAFVLSLVVDDQDGEGGTTESDAQRLRRARGRVEEAHQEMLDAESEANLLELGSAQDLDEAYAELATLGGRYDIWVPADWVVQGPGREARAPDRRNLMADFADYRRGATAFDNAEDLLRGLLGAAVGGFRELVVVAGSRKTLDLVATAVSIAVALTAGLVTFYFGEPFGSTADYLTVIAAGTAASLLTKALTDALTLRLPGEGRRETTVAAGAEAPPGGSTTASAA